jgi:protoporphyrinogen oxidase
MEMKIAVIGGGVSGLSVAQMLQKKNQEVVVFESEGRPGGMIKCDLVDGNLFHRTGGHVFNTKRKDVMEWFWTFFNREKEFVLAQRNSVVSMQNGKLQAITL